MPDSFGHFPPAVSPYSIEGAKRDLTVLELASAYAGALATIILLFEMTPRFGRFFIWLSSLIKPFFQQDGGG